MNLAGLTTLIEEIADEWSDMEFEYETLFGKLIISYEVVKVPSKGPRSILNVNKTAIPVYVYIPDERSYTEKRIGKPALGPSPPAIFNSGFYPATEAGNQKNKFTCKTQYHEPLH